MMTHPDHLDRVHLSGVHCGAVCQEMGERLSAALDRQSGELPPALLALTTNLQKTKSMTALKIVLGLNA